MVMSKSLGSDTAFVDTFYGNDGSNAFLANRGDYLYGFGGDDSFYTTSAAAMVDGGSGVDLLTISIDGGWLSPDSIAMASRRLPPRRRAAGASTSLPAKPSMATDKSAPSPGWKMSRAVP